MRPTGVVPPWLARPIALGGTLLFFGSLCYFAYSYEVVFGRDVEGSFQWSAVAIDVLLFSVFALHHSLFARDAVRHAVTRSVRALERSTYVWIASALFIAVCGLWRPIAGIVWRIDQNVFVALLRVAQLAGVWLSIQSAALIDIGELSGWRQLDTAYGDPGAAKDPHTFKTHGPYGWVRHPIYSGWFLMVFAVPEMTATRLVFALVSGAYLLAAIPLEERSLRRTAGAGYERYMRSVRWKLVPGVY